MAAVTGDRRKKTDGENYFVARGKTYAVGSIEEASRIYSQLRDESGRGARTWRDGALWFGGEWYRISYNGKVWRGMEWKPGDVPVFNPYASEAAA